MMISAKSFSDGYIAFNAPSMSLIVSNGFDWMTPEKWAKIKGCTNNALLRCAQNSTIEVEIDNDSNYDYAMSILK